MGNTSPSPTAVASAPCGWLATKKQTVETFPVKEIKRVRIVKRADSYYAQYTSSYGFCRYRGAHRNLRGFRKRFWTDRLSSSFSWQQDGLDEGRTLRLLAGGVSVPVSSTF